MLTFLARRIIGAILVCIAVTFVVFLIFVIVPGGGALGTAEAAGAGIDRTDAGR